MGSNADSFRDRPEAYRAYRPRYPAELYRYLAASSPSTGAALDAATGNGQAAIDLVERFDRVCAFDISAEQVAAALPHPRVLYTVCSAEQLPYARAEFDLVTVAQGAHWFDLPAFYRELRRVAKPGAILAIWGYSYCRVAPDVDAIVREVLLDAIEPYWAAGNRVIIERYRNIEFPFDEIDAPAFSMTQAWDLAHFIGYLNTWSAVKRFVAERHRDPTAALADALAPLWPERSVRDVEFDLPLRVGRIG